MALTPLVNTGESGPSSFLRHGVWSRLAHTCIGAGVSDAASSVDTGVHVTAWAPTGVGGYAYYDSHGSPRTTRGSRRRRSPPWNGRCVEDGASILRARLDDGEAPSDVYAQSLPGLIELDEHALEATADEIQGWRDSGIRVMFPFSDDYPAPLLSVYDYPLVLFGTGLRATDERTVAVVGSRAATPESLRMAGDLSALLAADGVTIASGLARVSTPRRTKLLCVPMVAPSPSSATARAASIPGRTRPCWRRSGPAWRDHHPVLAGLASDQADLPYAEHHDERSERYHRHSPGRGSERDSASGESCRPPRSSRSAARERRIEHVLGAQHGAGMPGSVVLVCGRGGFSRHGTSQRRSVGIRLCLSRLSSTPIWFSENSWYERWRRACTT